MFFKTFSLTAIFQVLLQLLFFISKKATVCMYKAGGFPNMSENSNINSAIKVRRLVKRVYLCILNSSNISAKELKIFLKMKWFFFNNINMQPDILDRSKISNKFCMIKTF